MLSVSDALILASGTVALEASLYNTPMLIAYRGPKILYWIYLLVRCIDKVSLPNIIADKWIIPELIEDNVTPSNIANTIEELLYDELKRSEMINELSKIREMLSENHSAHEVAKVINENIN